MGLLLRRGVSGTLIIMKVMILAAGRGERMRPLTDHTPKPLLRVGGKPLIVHHIERLAAAGLCDLVINHAHLGEQIVAALGDGSRWGVSIHYSAESEALETGGGIFQALPLLGETPFMVVNGDIWCDFDPQALQLGEGDLASLLLVENPGHNPDGDFGLQAGRISNDRRYTFSGIGIYSPELFADCEAGRFPLAPLLREAVEQGRVSGLMHRGEWLDVGTPERLAELDERLSARQAGRRSA